MKIQSKEESEDTKKLRNFFDKAEYTVPKKDSDINIAVEVN